MGDLKGFPSNMSQKKIESTKPLKIEPNQILPNTRPDDLYSND